MTIDLPPPVKDPEMSEAAMLELLAEYDIPIETWGREGKKTVSDLLKEINEGETVLKVREDGSLTRRVCVAGLDVLAWADGRWYKLVEDRQEFELDGAVKRRNISTSLGEKIHGGESSLSAMTRAVGEELGVDIQQEDVLLGGIERHEYDSSTYPGLVTYQELTLGVTVLSSDNFAREGYREVQEPKTTYFVWQEVKV